MDMTSEANLFTINPNGLKTHWKVSEGTTPEALNTLVKNVEILAGALASKGYKPDEMMRGPSGGSFSGNGASAATAAPAGDVPRCPDCSGEVYDNRGNRPSPKSPHFKCKNRNGCGAAGWLEANGSVRWQSGNKQSGGGQRY